MGWFNRKQDPISQRAHDLTRQIEQLESQIQQLATKAQTPSNAAPSAPRRPAIAQSDSPVTPPTPTLSPEPLRREPVFESINQQRLKNLTTPPPHFNGLGVRRYDLPAAWARLMNHVRGPSSANPKLVDLLAAGSLQGMRPLRYEKRIARNRFLVFVLLLVLLLWGIFVVFVRG